MPAASRRVVSFLAIVALVGLSFSARWIAASAWDSVVHYRSPYKFHPVMTSGPRLADRVVLVTMDGLRLDVSRNLPFLNELRARGADAVMLAGAPSLSNPGRAAMVTGAWADVHGITSNFAKQPVEVDSVFSLARRQGLRTAAAGTRFWPRSFGASLDAVFQLPEEPAEANTAQIVQWQREQCDAQLRFIRETSFNFLALDITAGDEVSHRFGPLSPMGAEVYAAADDCLRRVASAVESPRTVLIVASDHGHVARGGHGGSEPEVLSTPLVLAGRVVRASRPGATIHARQLDLAPTICALLGLPLPATSDGEVLLAPLNLDPQTTARIKTLHGEQQRQLRTFRHALLAGTLEEAVAIARDDRLPGIEAVGLALLLLLLFLFIMLFHGVEEWRSAVFGLVVFLAVYFGLFQLRGLGYSLSAVNKEAYLDRFFRDDMLIGGVALVAACFLIGIYRGPNARGSVFRFTAGLTLLIGLATAVFLLAIHWRVGLWMNAWLPSFDLMFQAYLDLLVLFALSFALAPAILASWAGVHLRLALRTAAARGAGKAEATRSGAGTGGVRSQMGR